MPENRRLHRPGLHKGAVVHEEMSIMSTTVLNRPAKVTTPGVTETVGDDALKFVELELALAAEDVRTEGFETAVRQACAACGVAFVFNLPVFGAADAQRVAAAGWRHDGVTEPSFAFFTLGRDGTSIAISAQCDSLDHAADVARAWFDLMTV